MGRRKEWLQRRTMIRSLLRTVHVSLKNISKGVLPVEWVRDLWDRIWEPRSLRREPPRPSRRRPPSRTRFWPDRSSWDPEHLRLASLLAWLRCAGSGIKFALEITINRNLSDISIVGLVLDLFVQQPSYRFFWNNDNSRALKQLAVREERQCNRIQWTTQPQITSRTAFFTAQLTSVPNQWILMPSLAIGFVLKLCPSINLPQKILRIDSD